MTKEAAEAIVNEAKQDKRLSVDLDTKRTSPRHSGGYKVKLTLRKFQTSITIVQPEDWPVTKDLWADL